MGATTREKGPAAKVAAVIGAEPTAPGTPPSEPSATRSAPGAALSAPGTAPSAPGTDPAAPGTAKPMRADAQRNYDQLLATASAMFLAQGVDASLEEIARQAGVGIGTLYRHFRTRNALIQAVYRREVEMLSARADALLATVSAEAALAEWMRGFVAHVAKKRGMAAALKAASEASEQTTSAELFSYARGLLFDSADRLLAAAIAEDAIRADVDSGDLIRAMSGICLANDQPDWQAQAARLVDLLMDGLRYRAPRP